MADGTVQVTLTHDEWVLTLTALHTYARTQDTAADDFVEGSVLSERHLGAAQKANQLHSKLALLFGDRP